MLREKGSVQLRGSAISPVVQHERAAVGSLPPREFLVDTKCTRSALTMAFKQKQLPAQLAPAWPRIFPGR